MFMDANELEFIEKSLTRDEAKKAHKDLPAGGQWRTMNGHHIYIVNGKIVAGSVPGVTKAKKMTKATMSEHQAKLDAKGTKDNAKNTGANPKKATGNATKKPTGNTGGTKGTKGSKESAKPAAKTVKGKADGTAKKPASKTKTGTKGAKPSADAKPKGTGKPVPGAKKAASEGGTKSKPAAKAGKPKDIRHEAQKNRNLAYDVGDKVGGARKDEFIASFKEKPDIKSLADLEKMSGAVAEKMVTKANLLPKFDANAEYESGSELPSTILKKLIYDRISPKPEPSNPETRKAYMIATQKINRHLAGIKTWDNMKNAIRELSDYARNTSTKHLNSTADSIKYYHTIATTGKTSWGSPESPENIAKAKERVKEFEKRLKDHSNMKDSFNFEALGEKFNNFFTNWDSMQGTIKTVQKQASGGWEKYLGEKKPKPKAERGAENKKWERKAEAQDLRTGGKKVKMEKPEQLMKEFGLRGVEFGNWVNDSSGKYHLQRSAEALHDLADVIGVDPKDISLNGRLALAFGARGKGGALAHYEPDRKVINMTKYGGAGSLAHEWGHAMDNIMQQYSEGGRESLSLASDGAMGDHDPKLKALYDNMIDAITKPAPGTTGGKHQVILDSSAKSLGRYYPEMRRQVQNGMEPADVYNHWVGKTNQKFDTAIERVKENRLGYYKTPEAQAKEIKKYEGQRKREISSLGHYLAKELELKQNGGKYGGEPYKGFIEVPTGKSEYLTRMEDTQPGKTQNGSHYWSQPAEMFARVFESYVQDKLDKEKRYNNYLVHGTREGNVKAEGAPFPIGKERQHMFKAMDNLMKYIGSKGTLKKALMLEILASGRGDMTEELRKSLGYTKRSAYNVANPEDVIYIPINRLRTVYQTEKATNWDKVEENRKRMEAGENLDPVSIGLDYDVHDGHHRIEAAKSLGHEHVPCIVKGGNDLERQRAEDAYREVWKSLLPDPTNPYEGRNDLMFRGIGGRELDFIRKNGYIQSKGKGNDDDKGVSTCFSNLWRQAEGYARSNYDQYNEQHAFVLAVPKPDDIEEDEHGELVSHRPIPFKGVAIIPIPKTDIVQGVH